MSSRARYSQSPISKRQPIITKPTTVNGRNMQNNARTSQPARSSATSTSLRKAPVIKSYLNDPQCIALREELMGADDPDYDDYDDEKLSKLMTHLKEYEHQSAINEDYMEANRARLLGEEIMSVLKIRKSCEFTSREIERDDVEQERMNQFDKMVKEKIDEFENETITKRETMQTLHEQQMTRLEKEWSTNKPAKYRKPSAHLLQLKHIEKNLAMSGDYDRAAIIHKETEELTKREMEEAQRNLVFDYKKAKAKLVQKQLNDSEQFEKSRAEGLDVLKNKYKVMRQKYENRESVLKAQRKASNARRANSALQSIAQPSPSISERTSSIHQNLLPPLIPPNDPNFLQEEERKQREDNKKKSQYHKKHAESAMNKFNFFQTATSEKKLKTPADTPSETQNNTPAKSTQQKSQQSSQQISPTANSGKNQAQIRKLNENDEKKEDEVAETKVEENIPQNDTGGTDVKPSEYSSSSSSSDAEDEEKDSKTVEDKEKMLGEVNNEMKAREISQNEETNEETNVENTPTTLELNVIENTEKLVDGVAEEAKDEAKEETQQEDEKNNEKEKDVEEKKEETENEEKVLPKSNGVIEVIVAADQPDDDSHAEGTPLPKSNGGIEVIVAADQPDDDSHAEGTPLPKSNGGIEVIVAAYQPDDDTPELPPDVVPKIESKEEVPEYTEEELKGKEGSIVVIRSLDPSGLESLLSNHEDEVNKEDTEEKVEKKEAEAENKEGEAENKEGEAKKKEDEKTNESESESSSSSDDEKAEKEKSEKKESSQSESSDKEVKNEEIGPEKTETQKDEEVKEKDKEVKTDNEKEKSSEDKKSLSSESFDSENDEKKSEKEDANKSDKDEEPNSEKEENEKSDKEEKTNHGTSNSENDSEQSDKKKDEKKSEKEPQSQSEKPIESDFDESG